MSKNLSILKTYFNVKAYNFKNEIKIICRYYKKFSFLFFDITFKSLHLFFNPYKISRIFLQKKGDKDIHTYGETSLITWEKIVQEVNISSSDNLFELGSGRGRTCFWSYYFLSCKVVGIERIPFFVKTANLLIKIFRIKKVSFLEKDMFSLDYSLATTIYLYGTCLSEKEIFLLIEKFRKLDKKTKIITISYPLSDYDPEAFQTEKSFPVSFAWGETLAYLQHPKDSSLSSKKI
jgi:hypothetical protein